MAARPVSTVGTLYSGPILVSNSKTIKAIGYMSGMTTSAVNSAAYTISGTVATPTFSPAGGTYTTAQTVTISTSTTGDSIRYTTRWQHAQFDRGHIIQCSDHGKQQQDDQSDWVHERQ